MSVPESKVVSLWEKTYKQHVKNNLITKLEAFIMIANELNIDYKAITAILKKRHDIHLIH